VGGVLDPAEWARRVALHCRGLLDASLVAIYLYDASADELRLLHLESSSPADPATIPPIPAGAGAVGKALLEQEAVALDDYPAWSGALPWAVALGAGSTAAVPLRVQGRAVGVLAASYEHPQRWSDSQLRILNLLAAQVAPALEAARLYQATLVELAQRVAAEETVRQNERHLATILERLPIAVLVIDSTGRIVISNDVCRRLARAARVPEGSSIEEWAEALQMRDPHTGRLLEHEEHLWSRVLAGEEVDEFDVLLRAPGQSDDWCLHASGTPLRDEAGEVTGGVLVFSDVTREHHLVRDLSAIALENVRLLRELEERRAQMEALARRMVWSPQEERRRAARRAEAQRLTARELEVVRLLAQGKTNKEIGRELGMEVGTVRNHVQRILEKLGAVSRAQAAARAVGFGLLETI
jgi:DNA-binding CsgD family transcriptional regulator/GAF domain-containing protein